MELACPPCPRLLRASASFFGLGGYRFAHPGLRLPQFRRVGNGAPDFGLAAGAATRLLPTLPLLGAANEDVNGRTTKAAMPPACGQFTNRSNDIFIRCYDSKSLAANDQKKRRLRVRRRQNLAALGYGRAHAHSILSMALREFCNEIRLYGDWRWEP